jgi:demethoxyubiquinone hydroxylase (CLK1/Coq7/Cat5 family)
MAGGAIGAGRVPYDEAFINPPDRVYIVWRHGMTHVRDFQAELSEYGVRPSGLRGAYRIVGFVFGAWSRLRGARASGGAGFALHNAIHL